VEFSKDIVQETFTRLWQKRTSLNPHKSLKAYLFRIAINLLTDHFRKKKRNPSFSLNNLPSQPTDDHPEKMLTIYDAICKLPENLYITFVLSRFQGLSYQEIAQACQVSVKTVESRMGKALKMLREMLR